MALIALLAGSVWSANGETSRRASIDVTKESRINASIEERPLQETLRMMAEKNLFEIKGAVPSGDPVTVHLSNVTLPEALKKIMRGYNYVLMDQGASRKPYLMVMGRTQIGTAGKGADGTAGPPPAAPNQASAGQDLVPGTYYVPPSQMPPASSSTQAEPPGRRPQDARRPDQPPGDRPQVQERQGAEPQVKPEDVSRGSQGQPVQQPQEQQQPDGGQPQAQPAGQSPTQPARTSGVTTRDLLGHSRTSSQS